MRLVVMVALVSVVVMNFVAGTTTQEHTFEISERGCSSKSEVSRHRPHEVQKGMGMSRISRPRFLRPSLVEEVVVQLLVDVLVVVVVLKSEHIQF
jgi:hypothetical protein